MSHIALLIGALAVTFPGVAVSQCSDFADGFGLGDLGLAGSTRALCTFDDGGGLKLYAGGLFTNYGNARVVRYDGASWSVVASGVPFDDLRDLAVWDDGTGAKLYAAGSFNSIDGVAAKRVAVWDGFAWSEVGGGLNNIANCLGVHDFGSGSRLVVAGVFTLAGSTPCTRIAAWDGTQWTALGSTLPQEVFDIVSFDDGTGSKLYATGAFGGRVRSWDGAIWSTVGSGLGGSAGRAFAVADFGQGQELVVGGQMFLNGGYGSVVRWNGSTWSALAGSSMEQPINVNALAVHDDGSGPRLYAGGSFNYSGTPQPSTGNVLQWNGSAWARLTSGLTNTNGGVWDMASFDDGSGPRLFIGGDFSSAGGYPSGNIARWGDACAAPTFVMQPQSTSTNFDLFAVIQLDVLAVGTAPLTYQWRKNGFPLVNSPPRLQGVTTQKLEIRFWTLEDAGDYDCVVTNSLGAATSNVAVLTVPLPPTGLPVQVNSLVAPGTVVSNLPSGATYSEADRGHRTGDDEFVFVGDISGSPGGVKALSRFSGGVASYVLRSQQSAPGCEPEAVFDSLAPFPYFEAVSGTRVALEGKLTGSIAPLGGTGIWFDDGSVTHLVARDGQAAAGGNAGETWRSFSDLTLSETGIVAFAGALRLNNVDIASALWIWDPVAGAQMVARGGSPAPGGGGVFGGADDLRFDAQGNLLVLAQRTLPGVPTAFGLWFGPPTALQPIVQPGDPAPGFAAGSTLENILYADVSPDGSVWFTASVLDSSGPVSYAVFNWNQGAVTLAMRRGDVAIGLDPGITFGAFELRNANSAGEALVYVLLHHSCPTPCSAFALYKVTAGQSPELILADRLDPLVGAPPISELIAIDHASLNDLGDVVVSCKLNFPGQGSYNAVYGWSDSRGLFPIAVPGGAFEVAPGQFLTVSNGYFTADPLSISGNVIFTLAFTSGQRGIYSSNFTYVQGVQLGAGVTVCSGDGSGTPCPCGNNSWNGAGCLNSTGQGAIVSALGTNRVSTDDLSFEASGLPNGKSTLLFQGASLLAAGSGTPFKDGVKCAGGTTRRFSVVQSSSSGTSSWGPGLANQGVWLAGQTRYFQVWYRDGAGAPCNKFSNLTNALGVTFAP